MVIHCTGQTTGDDIVRAFGRTKFTVKSKTMRGDKVEMAVEVFSDGVDMPYAEAIRALDGVEDLTLIQYNGEYHGQFGSGVLTNAGSLDAARASAGRSSAQTVAHVHIVRFAPLSRHLATAAARSLTFARPGRLK